MTHGYPKGFTADVETCAFPPASFESLLARFSDRFHVSAQISSEVTDDNGKTQDHPKIPCGERTKFG